jgi:hypothetical protein
MVDCGFRSEGNFCNYVGECPYGYRKIAPVQEGGEAGYYLCVPVVPSGGMGDISPIAAGLRGDKGDEN